MAGFDAVIKIKYIPGPVDIPPVVVSESLDTPIAETTSDKPPETSQPNESSVSESVEQTVPPDTAVPSRPSTSVKIYPKRSRKTVDVVCVSYCESSLKEGGMSQLVVNCTSCICYVIVYQEHVLKMF